MGKLENGGVPLIRINSPAAAASIVKGPTRFTLPYNVRSLSAMPRRVNGDEGGCVSSGHCR